MSLTYQYIHVRKPFDFRGNQTTNVFQESNYHFTGSATKPVVRKYDSRGDGDIDTGKGSKTYAQLEATLTKQNDRTARLSVTYSVWESSWETTTKKDRDRLYFTAYQDIDLSEYVKTTAKEDVKETLTWDFYETPKKAVYKDYYSNGNKKWNTVVLGSYPNVNKVQSWMPSGDLRFKVDDSGSELTRAGNIGVYGSLDFYIKVAVNKVESSQALPAYTMPSVMSAQTDGSVRQIKDIDDKAYSVLGCGYDITGEFASVDYVKKPVLDLDALKNHKRVDRNDNSKMTANHVSGSNTREVSSSYEKTIGGGASVSLFGATFKNETSKTVKDSDYSKHNCRTAMTRVSLAKRTYKIDGYQELGDLMPFLTKNFKDDLARLSPDAIINHYGTHVMLGAVIGASMNYSLSYLQSITKSSHSETFTSTSSISYNKSPSGAKKTDGDLSGTKAPSSKAEEAFSAFVNMSGNTLYNSQVFVQYVGGQKSGNGNGQSSQSGGNGGKSGGADFGGEAEFKYSTTSSKDVNEENESTTISITGRGGNEIYLSQLLDGNSKNSTKWEDSLSDSNGWVWVDYPKDTLVPIYKLIPTRSKALQVKDAWTTYLKDRGSAITPMGEKVVSLTTVAQGSKSDVITLRSDAEISTQSDKLSQFQIKFTPVNIDGGKVALAIRYKVSERYMEGGKDSLLQMSKVIEMPVDNSYKLAVSPYTMSSYDTPIMSYTGKVHGWIDITEQLENCPFVETKSNRVLIKIDGSGDDQSNMKISAKFCVPVVYYRR